MNRRPAFLLTTLAPLILLGGCATGDAAETTTDPPLDWDGRDTFAFATVREPPTAGGRRVAAREARRALRRGLEARLLAAGVAPSVRANANLLVGLHLQVEDVTWEKDPYYALEETERFERGTVTLDLSDARSGELLWRGRHTRRLRPLDPDAERNWKIEETLDVLTAAAGLPETAQGNRELSPAAREDLQRRIEDALPPR